MQIEQAIFTSAETDLSSGYQLVACSPGVREVDAQQLSNWGPSHDSLWEQGPDASSINFHPLPSGAYCISRTTPAGGEYSARRGPRIYTQCLVVGPELLARFANNPFTLLRAALAQGSLRVHEQVPERLQPFRLVGRAAAFDHSLLNQLSSDPGVAWLTTLLQAALEQDHVGLIAGRHGQRLVAGLLNCLPPECRREFSFSTGLRYSPRRPYRLVCLPDDDTERRRIERRYRLPVLNVGGKPPAEFSPHDGWPRLIAGVLTRRKAAWLASQLSHARPELTLRALQSLGDRLLGEMTQLQGESRVAALQSRPVLNIQWLARISDDLQRFPEDEEVWISWCHAHREALQRGDHEAVSELVCRACSILGSQPDGPQRFARQIAELLQEQFDHHPSLFRRTAHALEMLDASAGREVWLELIEGIGQDALAEGKRQDESPSRPFRVVAPDDNDVSSERRADAPHARFGSAAQQVLSEAVVADLEPTPSQVLGPVSAAVQEKLEQLDDIVFEAIAGKATALETLRVLWPATLQELGPELLSESKEQYVRHALSVWRHCVDGDEIRTPERAVNALEVLNVLFGNVT